MARKLTYLNNAATTWPKPSSVLKAADESFKRPYYESGRGMTNGSKDYPTLARQALAGLYHAENPENFAFSANATDALNTLIHGFAAKKDGRFHAITTELEHNSVLRPLYELRRKGRIDLSVVPFDDRGHVDPAAVGEAIRDETALAVLTHGSNVMGSVQDIPRMSRILHERGVYLVVDAAQTAGLTDIDLTILGADAFVFTGHKYLFSLPGVGGFHIRDPESIEPIRQGGTGIRSGQEAHPIQMPYRFEAGTPNYPGIASLCAGLRYIERRGQAKVRKKTMSLADSIIRALAKEGNITLYNGKPDLPIISFNIQGLDNADVSYILLHEYGIVSRPGLHCAPLAHLRIDGGKGCVRLSPSCLNTEKECRNAQDAVREIARSPGKGKR
ncbi:MAG: aminotransferase class V-fold PLP-dependent enzyme [Candidatus Altiarchaeota archaeon]